DRARAHAGSGALRRARARLADAARAGRREDGRAARDRRARRTRGGRRRRGAGPATAVPALDRVECKRLLAGAGVVNVATIALHELRIGLRNRWAAATTVVLAALALSLALLGSAPTGIVKTDPVAVVVVSLSSLTILLVPLIALMLSFDAIVGEHERGTLALLLSYPVRRWQVVVGKVVGQTTILGFATVVGYGAAALALWYARAPVQPAWSAYAAMVGTSVL